MLLDPENPVSRIRSICLSPDAALRVWNTPAESRPKRLLRMTTRQIAYCIQLFNVAVRKFSFHTAGDPLSPPRPGYLHHQRIFLAIADFDRLPGRFRQGRTPTLHGHKRERIELRRAKLYAFQFTRE